MIQMSNYCLKVTYDDDKMYERKFDNISEIPYYIKENFLKPAITCIIFADDMTEAESMDYEAFFNDIVTENDPETMAVYAEHIKVWNETISTTDALCSTIKIFNEIYSKDCNLDNPTRYQLKKEHARRIAIYWQSGIASRPGWSLNWLANWMERFERIGRKYGLIREFKENGIL
jgi:hypothetical protein